MILGVTALACGSGGSGPTGNSTGSGTTNQPPANAEFIYSYIPTLFLLEVSSIDTTTGEMTQPTLALGYPGGYNSGMMANPVVGAFYSLDWSNGDGEIALYAFSVTDAEGTLSQVHTLSQTNASQSGNGVVDPKGRFIYITEGPDGISDGINGTIQEFTLDKNGLPAPASYVQSPAYMGAVGIDPMGRFLYVFRSWTDGVGISVYAIDPTTGALTLVPGSPFSTSGCWADNIWVDPTGRFLYASLASSDAYCQSQDSVIGFSVDSSTGALARFPGSAFLGDNIVNGFFSFDPAGTHAFIATVSNPTISGFTIDPASGVLSPTGSSVPLGGGSVPIVDPSGNFLYLADGANTISSFKIDAVSGALTRIMSVQFPSNEYPSWPVLVRTQ